jgi:hypothetical protein
MPSPNSKSTAGKEQRGFRISDGAVATLGENERAEFVPDAFDLPRVYGPPILFAIARDPRTIFACWNIDWPSVFKHATPVDRQVHLRIYRTDGTEETSAAVEPMAGHCDVAVSQPRGDYRVEIGYYAPEGVWNSAAASDEVTMPPENIAESMDLDLATIPFHLSFQRLIDLFRGSNGSDALSEIISRLQKRALSEEDRALLSPEEWEILRAMNLSLDEIDAAQRVFSIRASEAALRRRAEALLGFGSASPSRAFGESSS